MSIADFQATLRKYMGAHPFHPYIVELEDGGTIKVNQPELVIAGERALFLTDNDLVEFRCQDVRQIRETPAGTPS